jgi:hypothetical protein
MKKILFIMTMAAAVLLESVYLYAAVGCDLNDPDRDVRRLFPGSTGFKTIYLSIDRRGGEKTFREIESRLGDSFTGLYETIDVPYTVYEILRGKEVIGYIHGVNQKGRYGGIQVFLSLDKNGVITNFYIQKLTSRDGAAFRSPGFASQFKGLTLKDFYAYDIKKRTAAGTGGASSLKNPAAAAEDDFRSVLRGVKKNLIIMDEYFFANRHLQFFKQEKR